MSNNIARSGFYNKKLKLLIFWLSDSVNGMFSVFDIDNGYGYIIKDRIYFLEFIYGLGKFADYSLDKIPNDIQIKMGINNIKKDGTLLLPPFDENSDWDTNIKINISKLNNLNSTDFFKDILSSFSSNDLKDNFISKLVKLLHRMNPLVNVTYNKTIRLITGFKD